MPTIGSVTKTIRINPKDLEVIEELMKDGTTWSGAIHKLCEGNVPHAESLETAKGVPEKPSVSSEGVPLSKEIVKQIEEMCMFLGVDTNTFLKEICKGLESGQLGYENGLKTYGSLDTSRFEDACHDKGADPEKMLEKATQMVWRS